MMISFRHNDYLYSYSDTGGVTVPTHTHKYYEVMYFIHARGKFIVENNEYELSDGDLFVTRPGEVHSIHCVPKTRYERHFVQVSQQYLKYSGVNLAYFSRSRIAGEYNKIDRELTAELKIGEFFDKLPYYIVNRLPESDIMAKTYIIQLMVQINNAYKRMAKNASANESLNKKVSDIIRFIDDTIPADITLDDICEKFYISKYYLCHMFKETTGYSVGEFINIRRINLAKSLLLDSSSPKAVCFDCGFNDYSVFYKTFKKQTGVSPSRFLASIE